MLCGWRPCSLETGSSSGYQCLSFTLHMGKCSGPSGTAEFLPASICQPRSTGTWAIYWSEQFTREGSTQRWRSRAAGEVNTLEHSCARSQLLCKGTLQWQVLNVMVKLTIWKREYLLHEYSQEPMLFVPFPDAFDKLSRSACWLCSFPVTTFTEKEQTIVISLIWRKGKKIAFLKQRRSLQNLLQKSREATVVQTLQDQNG